MRALAALACLFATGCATSLGVVVPGVTTWEHREGPTPTPVQTARTLQLAVDRPALSLRAEATLSEQRVYRGEMRRVEQPLTWAIEYSWFAEHAEHYIGIFLLPVVGPILLWHLAWWIYGRGLGPDERAVRPPPWGWQVRDAFWWAIWPGHNAEALWRWRADLLPLTDAELGPWRNRTRTVQVPVAGQEVGLGVAGDTLAMPPTGAGGHTGLALRPPADTTKPWYVGPQRVEVTAAQPLKLTATVTGAAEGPLSAEIEVPAAYLADAAAARTLRARQARAGRSAALHQALAALYQRQHGYLQARCEWRRVARLGDAKLRATAVRRIGSLWRAEERAARQAGDDRRALFCAAVAGLELALRTEQVDRSPLDGGAGVIAARLREGSVRTAARTALAVAATAGSPAKEVRLALLQVAADHRRPVAAWAACAALIRHPTADAAAVLPVVFRPQAPPALRRAAAQAILWGAPDTGLQRCIDAADDGAVQWVLADATGAGLDPVREDWQQWRRARGAHHQWRPAEWMFRAP